MAAAAIAHPQAINNLNGAMNRASSRAAAPVASVPAAAPRMAPLSKPPGILGGAIEGSFNQFSSASMLLFVGGMAAGLFKKLAEWNVLGSGRIFRPLHTVASTPERAMNSTVAEAGTAISSGLKRVKLDGAAEKAANMEKRAGGMIMRGADRAATHLGSVVEKARGRFSVVDNVLNRFGSRHEKAAAAMTALAEKSLNEVSGNLGKIDSGVADALRKVQAAAAVNDVTGHEAARKALDTAMDAAEKALGGDKAGKELLSKTKNGFTAFADNMMGAAGRSETASRWKNPVQALKDMPQRLANAKLSTVVNHGVNITYNAMVAYHSARMMSDGVDALKQMHQDLTGKKIGTFKLLFGSIPSELKEARRQYWKSALPRAVSNIAGLLVGNYFSRGSAGMGGLFKMMGSNMAINMAGEYMAGNNPYVTTYAAIHNTQAAGERVTAEQYAQLIACASEGARKSGGMDNKAVMQMGQYFAQRQFSAGDVLRACTNGEIDKLRAQLAAMPEQQQQASAAQQQQKPVVGAHTQRLQQQAMGRGAGAAIPARP